MNEPFFSVVVAAYNAQDTIRSSVESALAQSDDDLELIIIDDGSTDQTLKIAIQLSCEDSRVHVVSQPNSGPASARNHGARIAKGKFVAFLDADDAWHCEKLTKHWAIHDGDAGLDASFAKVHFCPENNGEMVPGRTFSQIPVGNIEMADILVENTICTTSNFVVKRDNSSHWAGSKKTCALPRTRSFSRGWWGVAARSAGSTSRWFNTG
ncbi:MAG: glycosyltransferase family 2 protein [Erythrobacter sp.]|nr:glycosyltransferase family 2 protein [Erythrobacter sp.]